MKTLLLFLALFSATACADEPAPEVELLDFTASYCKPCQQMLPILQDRIFMAALAVVAIFIVILAFLGKVKLSEIKAQKAADDAKEKVRQLQATAPSFAAVAEAELRKLQFTNAMANIDQAISLNNTNASFHNTKGNILTSLQEFELARKSFETAKELDPRHPEALRSSVVLAGLLRDNTDFKKLKTENYRQLYELMRDQCRTEEAGLMFARFAAGDTKILDTFRKNPLRNHRHVDVPTRGTDLIHDGHHSRRVGRIEPHDVDLRVAKRLPQGLCEHASCIDIAAHERHVRHTRLHKSPDDGLADLAGPTLPRCENRKPRSALPQASSGRSIL